MLTSNETAEQQKKKAARVHVDATKVHNGHDVKGDLRAAAAVNVPSTVLAATPFRFRVKKKRKIKNAFLKYTAFLCLQYISLATIVPFWINLLSC